MEREVQQRRIEQQHLLQAYTVPEGGGGGPSPGGGGGAGADGGSGAYPC
jgi:hypothetical protein